MTKFEQEANKSFDPSGSIFLPKTKFPDREFSSWETSIMLRRGELFSNVDSEIDSFSYQQELYDELCRVRDWYMGSLAYRVS